jgi:DNA-binding transcriptional regulator LsrR (DeoR family)
MSRRPKRWYRNMTQERADQIRRRYLAREARQRELASEYGITQHSVSRIVSGQVWAR